MRKFKYPASIDGHLRFDLRKQSDEGGHYYDEKKVEPWWKGAAVTAFQVYDQRGVYNILCAGSSVRHHVTYGDVTTIVEVISV